MILSPDAGVVFVYSWALVLVNSYTLHCENEVDVRLILINSWLKSYQP